jgi:hypothetical protein
VFCDRYNNCVFGSLYVVSLVYIQQALIRMRERRDRAVDKARAYREFQLAKVERQKLLEEEVKTGHRHNILSNHIHNHI